MQKRNRVYGWGGAVNRPPADWQGFGDAISAIGVLCAWGLIGLLIYGFQSCADLNQEEHDSVVNYYASQTPPPGKVLCWHGHDDYSWDYPDQNGRCVK